MSSAPAPRLELRQSQQLAMTQALQQSIKLLQMNALELREYVETQLEENPLLTQDEPEESADSVKKDESEPEALDTSKLEHEDAPSSEWDENAEPIIAEPSYTSSKSHDNDTEDNSWEVLAAKPISLREHLTEQLHTDIRRAGDRMIGMHLIDALDEAGYWRGDAEALATQLGTVPAHVLEVLHRVQRFDPAGVFARDLGECLRLQLKEKDRLDPAMEKLVANLDLLGSGKLEALKKTCAVDADDLREMIAEIKSLNPKPGLAFTHEPVQAVEPDVFVRRLPDESWHVELNSGALPRVLVNQRYHAKLQMGAKAKEDKKYIAEKLNHASWLVKALDQRANTLLRVATELVAEQDAFFRLGVRYLKPLTLKDIAAKVGVHESTVSRVTTAKYISSARGIHELKYFFTSSLTHSAGGENVSSEAVRHLIKELIDKEDTPLSDDEITLRLKERNINVARRTVAKYREGMGIATSNVRRRVKRVG